MRHGQGYHGIADNGHNLRDPHLTGEGQRQCRARRAIFDRHDQIELLCASPLRRALQTCAITFAPAVARGLRIIALPMAEECSSAPMDTGSEPALLRAEFGTQVDFSRLEADLPSTETTEDADQQQQREWFQHVGKFGTDPPALIRRAAALRRWLRDRPEAEIALVAHGFFNHYLTGDVDEQGQQTTPWWGEAECRTYEFVGEGEEGAAAWEGGPRVLDGEDVAMLRETKESLERRGEGGGKQGVKRSMSLNWPAERHLGKNQGTQDGVPNAGTM